LKIQATAWCMCVPGQACTRRRTTTHARHPPPASHSTGHAGSGGGLSPATSHPRATQVVALVVRARKTGSRPPLECIRTQVRYGACLPLPQTDFGMDNSTGQAPRASRPMDMGGARRLYTVATGTSVCCGSEAALGTPLRSRTPDTVVGPSERFGTFARTRHTCEATETLWKLTGTLQRPPFGTSQALPGPQKGCLSPRKP
jgi:hypothetical protein